MEKTKKERKGNVSEQTSAKVVKMETKQKTPILNVLAKIFVIIAAVFGVCAVYPLVLGIIANKVMKSDKETNKKFFWAIITFLFVSPIGGLFYMLELLRNEETREEINTNQLLVATKVLLVINAVTGFALIYPFVLSLIAIRKLRSVGNHDRFVWAIVTMAGISSSAGILFLLHALFVKYELAAEVSEVSQAVLDEKHSTSRLISKRRHVALPQWAVAWIVLLPAMIFLVFFMFYPIINSFFMAFIQDFDWNANAGTSFALGSFFEFIAHPVTYTRGSSEPNIFPIPSIGFDNFIEVWRNPFFVPSIWHTAVLVVIEVPLTIIVALLIATFLNSIKALKGLYQTIFFLPYVTNSIALGLIFNMLFNAGAGGIINLMLKTVGINPVGWLNTLPYMIEYADGTIYTVPAANEFTTLVVIVMYALWNGLAFKILVFMSGLATIDKQYSDAAKVDGANSVTIWRRITLPLLSPQILYITITSFIGAFKMYTGVMAVFVAGGEKNNFGGADGRMWEPIVGWIYRSLEAGSDTKPGIAAAGSIVLLLIILAVTALQGVISKRRVHY